MDYAAWLAALGSRGVKLLTIENALRVYTVWKDAADRDLSEDGLAELGLLLDKLAREVKS